MKLLIEKLKLALQKRTGAVQQKKSRATWLAKGYRQEPMVSFVLQSHDKSLQICHVLPKLREYKNAEIIVIDDGSKLEHTQRLAQALTGANEWLVRTNDLFENITYDRVLRLARGRYVALMQDGSRRYSSPFSSHCVWTSRSRSSSISPMENFSRRISICPDSM